MQNQQQEELDRVSSDLLPVVITTVAMISLFFGILFSIAAIVRDLPYVLTPALSSVLASPFLFGFADIVRSMRIVARKSLG